MIPQFDSLFPKITLSDTTLLHQMIHEMIKHFIPIFGFVGGAVRRHLILASGAACLAGLLVALLFRCCPFLDLLVDNMPFSLKIMAAKTCGTSDYRRTSFWVASKQVSRSPASMTVLM